MEAVFVQNGNVNKYSLKWLESDREECPNKRCKGKLRTDGRTYNWVCMKSFNMYVPLVKWRKSKE